MKKSYIILKVILALGLILLFNFCAKDAEPSLYELVKTTGQAPRIDNIVSSTSTPLAGYSTLTINGSNFSSNKDENFVFFDGKKGTVLSSTTNKIEVKSPPNVFGDSVKVRVTVHKNENISNTFIFRIVNPINIPFPFDPKVGDIPYSVTVFNDGDFLVSLDGKGIKKISRGVISDYIPKGAEAYWNTIKLTSNGEVYGARNLRGIWKLTQNNPPPVSPWAITPSGTRIWDFDWDQNLNIWAVGNNNVIVRIKPDLTTETYNFTANLRTARVFGGYLYVAGSKDNLEKVWRFVINSDGSLGTEEEVINLSSRYPTIVINTMAFSADGVMYLGTNNKNNPILEVKTEFYPGIIPASEVLSFYWPAGEYLYFIRKAETNRDQTVIRVNMLKNGAPNFGN